MENRNFDVQQKTEDTINQRSGRAWIFGAVLTLAGVIILMQNTGFIGQNNGNWGALFLMIPALIMFANAYNDVKANGSMSKKARSGMIFGVILTMITAMLVFNLDERIYGPIILICAGLGIFLNSYKGQ